MTVLITILCVLKDENTGGEPSSFAGGADRKRTQDHPGSYNLFYIVHFALAQNDHTDQAAAAQQLPE